MRIQLALGPRCLTLSSDNVVRITDIVRFKLSRLPRTGRRSTSSPRTSVLPKFNCQSATSKLSRRIQRQPLTVLGTHRIVNPSNRIRDDFFRVSSTVSRASNPYRTRPAKPTHLVSAPTVSNHRRSKRVRIVLTPRTYRKPHHNNKIDEARPRPSTHPNTTTRFLEPTGSCR